MPSPLPPTELLFLSVKAQLKGHHVDLFTNKHKNPLRASLLCWMPARPWRCSGEQGTHTFPSGHWKLVWELDH